MSHRRDDFEITHTTVDGRQVVHKAADRPEARESVRYEREVLARIDHPGVVQLVTTEDSSSLVTALAGSATLADLPTIDVEYLTRITAHVALTLAELHRLGWAHGAVQPDHLIVGPAGQVTLCSLRRASRVSGLQASAAGRDATALADTIEWSLDRVECSPRDASLRSRLEACIVALRSDGAGALQSVGDLSVHTPRAAPVTRLPTLHRARPAQFETTTRVARPVRGDRAEMWTSLSTAGVCGVALIALRFLGPISPDTHADWTPIRIALVSVWSIAALIALAGLALHLLIALALWRDSVRLAELVERVAPPRLRQALAVVAAAGVTISSIGAVTAQRPDPVSATVRPLHPSTSATTTTAAVVTPSTATSMIDAASLPEPTAPVTTPDAGPIAGPTVTPARAEYRVAAGDHLWGIAAQTMALTLGRSPTDVEIDPYWRSLIDLNRNRLIDPSNPDLIEIGQIFELPHAL